MPKRNGTARFAAVAVPTEVRVGSAMGETPEENSASTARDERRLAIRHVPGWAPIRGWPFLDGSPRRRPREGRLSRRMPRGGAGRRSGRRAGRLTRAEEAATTTNGSSDPSYQSTPHDDVEPHPPSIVGGL